MMRHFAILEDKDNINPLEANQRFQQLSDALLEMTNGGQFQDSPTISSFTNAQHDHADGAGGGQLTVGAIDSESADDGNVAVSDGGGNVSWSDLASSFTGLSDTPSSYSSQGNKVLRVNSAGDAIEFAPVPAKDSHSVNEVSDYTTSSGSFVDVDGTDLSFTLNTNGGDVLVLFLGGVYPSTTGIRIYFEIDVDGSPEATEDGITVWQTTDASEIANIGIVWLVEGLDAGAHTIKLQWKVSSGTATMPAGAGTSTLDVHPQFIAMEVLS